MVMTLWSIECNYTRFHHSACVLLLNGLDNPLQLEIDERKQLFKCMK